MDFQPKTRKESKKSAKDKAGACYSAKRVRQMEAQIEKNVGKNTGHTPTNK